MNTFSNYISKGPKGQNVYIYATYLESKLKFLIVLPDLELFDENAIYLLNKFTH